MRIRNLPSKQTKEKLIRTPVAQRKLKTKKQKGPFVLTGGEGNSTQDEEKKKINLQADSFGKTIVNNHNIFDWINPLKSLWSSSYNTLVKNVTNTIEKTFMTTDNTELKNIWIHKNLRLMKNYFCMHKGNKHENAVFEYSFEFEFDGLLDPDNPTIKRNFENFKNSINNNERQQRDIELINLYLSKKSKNLISMLLQSTYAVLFVKGKKSFLNVILILIALLIFFKRDRTLMKSFRQKTYTRKKGKIQARKGEKNFTHRRKQRDVGVKKAKNSHSLNNNTYDTHDTYDAHDTYDNRLFENDRHSPRVDFYDPHDFRYQSDDDLMFGGKRPQYKYFMKNRYVKSFLDTIIAEENTIFSNKNGVKFGNVFLGSIVVYLIAQIRQHYTDLEIHKENEIDQDPKMKCVQCFLHDLMVFEEFGATSEKTYGYEKLKTDISENLFKEKETEGKDQNSPKEINNQFRNSILYVNVIQFLDEEKLKDNDTKTIEKNINDQIESSKQKIKSSREKLDELKEKVEKIKKESLWSLFSGDDNEKHFANKEIYFNVHDHFLKILQHIFSVILEQPDDIEKELKENKPEFLRKKKLYILELDVYLPNKIDEIIALFERERKYMSKYIDVLSKKQVKTPFINNFVKNFINILKLLLDTAGAVKRIQDQTSS